MWRVDVQGVVQAPEDLLVHMDVIHTVRAGEEGVREGGDGKGEEEQGEGHGGGGGAAGVGDSPLKKGRVWPKVLSVG